MDGSPTLKTVMVQLTSIAESLVALNESFQRFVEINEKSAVSNKGKERVQLVYRKATEMPDVVDYGLWDCKDISGIWGTGSHYKKVGFLAYTNNYNCHTQSNTTVYHEFTKWLFRNPRNRNFWMTGNMVEVYRRGKLTKMSESDFRAKHAGVLKCFFEDFCADREEDLLEEARNVLGEPGNSLMSKLYRYLADKEFTNPKADSILSNSVCKSTIKQIRNHLREKKLDSE